MARFIFGGEITHLVVSEDGGNADALIVAPVSTAVPLRATVGGVVVTDFLLWDGSAFTIVATAIVSDANGHLPPFQGPDGVSILYDAQGYAILARDDPSGAAADWDTLVDKPAVVAAGATQALARDSILAASSTEMTTLEAQTGTGATGVLIEPAVLKAGINRHAPANVHMMAVWSGSGAHPLRTANLPTGFFEIWRQPTAPLTTAGYALPGDEWEVTE